MVSEAGASVYSASEVAIEEFPDLDLTARGAISIARRLQDPLAELVKIDPKSIGVGQYQHDVDQKLLKQKLDDTVESCVNYVGVDLNLASKELLSFVAGVSSSVAKNVVAYRNEHGAFRNRKQLLEIPKFGPKTFEQAAGFLRIRNGENPLDNTAVHPESYFIVEKMARDLDVPLDRITENPARFSTINLKQYVTEAVGEPTLRDIVAELEKPGRDPRAEFRYATFREEVKEIKDLVVGMELEGIVTNVANFGAFVDIGVHQDGLVHVSQLADRFVDDPKKFVKVGQIVKVRVLEVNEALKRISLTMKSPGRPAKPKMPEFRIQKTGVRRRLRLRRKRRLRPFRICWRSSTNLTRAGKRLLLIKESADSVGAQQTLCLFSSTVECPHGRGVIHAKESRLNIVIRTDNQQPVLIQGPDHTGERIQWTQSCARFPQAAFRIAAKNDRFVGGDPMRQALEARILFENPHRHFKRVSAIDENGPVIAGVLSRVHVLWRQRRSHGKRYQARGFDRGVEIISRQRPDVL